LSSLCRGLLPKRSCSSMTRRRTCGCSGTA
jgi:hypothetical protein